MTAYRLVAEPRTDLDIAAAYQWYETERAGLGLEFLDQLSTAYDRIAEDPFKYQNLESGIRRALLRRFPYAVYFAVESDVIVILAVLHVSRDPVEWQRRRRL
ncbi:MAG: type II toxin-antitoxin system RelE/ParE family toxin [Candidatus Rokuibacteriota bacterium]